MTAHLPALIVVVPLLAGPLCLLLRRPGLAVALGMAAIAFAAACAGTLLWFVRDGAVLSYWLGGWEPPWGIEYRVDRLNAFVLVVVTMIAAFAFPIGVIGAVPSIRKERRHLFCAAFLLCMTGLIGITVTGDAFNVFVFLEIASLASYTLVGLGEHRRALRAAFAYLVMGTIGGTFVLIGIGLLYQVTGTLNMADLAERLPPVRHLKTVRAAFAFLTVGTGIKLAVFPLHQWLPNAYAYAPSAVSAFLSGTGTKVIYYLLIRAIFGIFGAAFVFDTLGLQQVLLPLSLVAIFAGSVAAIYQKSVKRLLAYSSIAQIGYLTLALSLGTEAGLAAGLMHVFNHAITKAGLFLAVACMTVHLGSDALDRLEGVGRTMPASTAAFVVGGLSLIGIPATAGFVSKWYLVLAALEAAWPIVALAVLVSSLLAVVYVWRVVEVAYFRSAPQSSNASPRVPKSMLVPAWLLVGLTAVFGVYTDPTTRFSRAAARQLFEMGASGAPSGRTLTVIGARGER